MHVLFSSLKKKVTNIDFFHTKISMLDVGEDLGQIEKQKTYMIFLNFMRILKKLWIFHKHINKLRSNNDFYF